MIQTFSENGGGGGGGGGGGRGRGRRSVTTLTTIDDEAVPQAVMIPDPEIPLASLPKTGDTTPLLMLGAMTAVSFLLLSALGILWIRMRRKEDKA